MRNFRNFPTTGIPLFGNVVPLEEKQVGKSNLLFAVRPVRIGPLDVCDVDIARSCVQADFVVKCGCRARWIMRSASPQMQVFSFVRALGIWTAKGQAP